MTGSLLRQSPASQALERHHSTMATWHLRDLFAEDPGRGERLCAEAAGIYLDCSNHRITDEETLFVVCSKTFTTLETLTNATSARRWLVERLGDTKRLWSHGADELVIDFSDPGTIEVAFLAKEPGPTMRLGQATMAFGSKGSFAPVTKIAAPHRWHLPTGPR